MPDWDAKYAAAPSDGLYGSAPNAYLVAVLCRMRDTMLDTCLDTGERTAGAPAAPKAADAPFSQHTPPRSALLIADGDGRNGRWTALQGLATTAVDLSATATQHALAKDAAAGAVLTRLTGDAADPDLALPVSDLVAVIYLHGPTEMRRAVITRAWSLVAPGGCLVLEAFAKEHVRTVMGPGGPDLQYSAEELRVWLPGAQFTELLTSEVLLAEGAGHRGPAQVVRAWAHKPT
ncbi:MAG: hypothetical protein AAFO79_04065 [Pseudomonadota bacterium]